MKYDPYSTDILALLVDARALRTVGLSIITLAIDSGKVIKLRNRVTTNRLPASPPIRRAHLGVLILHPPCISAAHHT